MRIENDSLLQVFEDCYNLYSLPCNTCGHSTPIWCLFDAIQALLSNFRGRFLLRLLPHKNLAAMSSGPVPAQGRGMTREIRSLVGKPVARYIPLALPASGALTLDLVNAFR